MMVKLDGGPRRVNLGCGDLPLDGYVNIDLYGDKMDLRADIRFIDFKEPLDEVRMDHVLEHLSIADGVMVLHHAARWLAPGGRLVVEVPDMAELMANPGPRWLTDIYGVQDTKGQFHRSGYTAETLGDLVEKVRLRIESVSRFRSTHPHRPGFPCLEVIASK
jgi:predicted SAM-dependent methyltransferase